jgi:hypothetical protein
VRDLIDARMNDTENPPTPMNEMWAVFGAAAWREQD